MRVIKEISYILIGLSIVVAIIFGIVSISTQYDCGQYYEECKSQNTRFPVTSCRGSNDTQFCCDLSCWDYQSSKPYCGDTCCSASPKHTKKCSLQWPGLICGICFCVCLVSSCCACLCSNSLQRAASNYTAPKVDVLAEQRRQIVRNLIQDNSKSYR